MIHNQKSVTAWLVLTFIGIVQVVICSQDNTMPVTIAMLWLIAISLLIYSLLWVASFTAEKIKNFGSGGIQ
jgi:hypothetical protein